MAVDDHEVHSKVKHQHVVYGCWNKPRGQHAYVVPVRLFDGEGNYVGTGTETIEPRMSALCRHTGDYSKDPDGKHSWKEDPWCDGCAPSNKDHDYISRMRRMVEQEVQSAKLRG